MRQSFADLSYWDDLKSLREAIADHYAHDTAIGLFSVVYDKFGPEFETFVLDDQARRDRGEPIKSEPEMAEQLRMLAEAAEFYAAALLAGNH